MITFNKAVTTSGTPVNLPENPITNEEFLYIKGKNTNTGAIFVGTSSANALKTAGIAYTILKNEVVKLKVENARLIWIDAATNGEGVECLIA